MQPACFGCLVVLLAPFLVLANVWFGPEQSRAGDCAQWGVTACDDLSCEGSGSNRQVCQVWSNVKVRGFELAHGFTHVWVFSVQHHTLCVQH
jgi:hypothetical protein